MEYIIILYLSLRLNKETNYLIIFFFEFYVQQCDKWLDVEGSTWGFMLSIIGVIGITIGI